MADDPFAAHAGSLTAFLAELTKHDERQGRIYQAALVDTFQTEDGRKALQLLDKAILLAQPPLGASDCALRQMHGQRHLVAEMKRIAAYGRGTGNDRS